MKVRNVWLRIPLVAVLILLITRSTLADPSLQGPLESGELALAGTVASRIVYQGRLTDTNGNPLTGSYNLVFQLWNDATAGSKVQGDIAKNAVAVHNGLFTVELDVTQNVFNGQALWLQVQVSGQNLAPRHALLPAPYALSLVPGSVISAGDRRTTVSGTLAGVYGWSSSSPGVRGLAEGPCDPGVYGVSNYTGAETPYCISDSAGTRAGGVFIGLGNTKYGAVGRTANSIGSGLYGEATAGTGLTSGVFGKAVSSTGSGVQGDASGTSGVGVRGWARGNYGEAVRGEATGPYGSGGVFIAEGANGKGIWAKGRLVAADLQGKVQVRSFSSGGIVLEMGEGLDYSEGFDVTNESQVAPGDVLVIDAAHPGQLALSMEPYDSKVAGIVAGANGLGSAIRVASEQFDRDVALAGRVYCNVDATDAAVETGDLLTTSSRPGYAMKVLDHLRAQGAILGKAMEPLAKGQTGQILVLVTLQ